MSVCISDCMCVHMSVCLSVCRSKVPSPAMYRHEPQGGSRVRKQTQESREDAETA